MNTAKLHAGERIVIERYNGRGEFTLTPCQSVTQADRLWRRILKTGNPMLFPIRMLQRTPDGIYHELAHWGLDEDGPYDMLLNA